MRYVLIKDICENMILVKSSYRKEGQLIVNPQYKVFKSYINGKKIGLLREEIQSSLYKESEIENLSSNELRNKTVYKAKELFAMVENSEENIYEFNKLKEQIEVILEKILKNCNLIINMADLKNFDQYTYEHSVNVAILSMVLGSKIGISNEEMYNLGMAAILHDIGKVFIPKEILNKPGKLTENEMDIMKKHSYLGYEYLKNRYEFSASACIGVLDHHEKYDGTGYPNGKKGKDISLFGRIINIVDVYDALTSKRAYRKGLLQSDAIKYIINGSGKQFDPGIVNIFIEKISPYLLGTCIKLDNRNEDVRVKTYKEDSSRHSTKAYKVN